MIIQCEKSQLLAGVSTALRAVPSKTTMTILECILIETESGEIKISATDMDLGIETVIEGHIIENGHAAVNAKLFFEIIRKLPDNEVHIETDEHNQAKITCEKSKFRIPVQTGDDFPRIPDVEKNLVYRMSQFSLKEIIRQTIFAIADTEVNPVFSGELFEFDGDKLRVIALDGQRIAIRNLLLKETYDVSSVIVPGKTLSEISRILPGSMENDVNMYVTPLHMLFEFDRTIVVTRLIEGEFFKVDRMLSPDYSSKIQVEKKDFQDCLERASLLLRESDRRPVVMSLNDGFLNLNMQSQIGMMDEDIEVESEGKNMEIGFNPRFMLEVMRVIDDEQIRIYLTNPRSPIMIKDDEGTYTYIVLPISLNAGVY